MSDKLHNCPNCQDAHKAIQDCAFKEDGTFDPNNWNCETIALLLKRGDTIEGNDHSTTLVSHPDEVGMIALSTFRTVGTVSQAILIGVDKQPAKDITFSTAIRFLNYQPNV